MQQRCRVTGFVRGRELAGDATVDISGETVRLAWENAALWELERSAIEGATADGDVATLYLAGGDALELRPAAATGAASKTAAQRVPAGATSPAAVSPATATLMRHIWALPELARGLRSFGTAHGGTASTHTLWFGALLDARKRAQHSGDPITHIELFDAAALRDAQLRAISEIAALGVPQGGAQFRAMEAVLEEAADPMFRELAALAPKAQDVAHAPHDTRMNAWREWVDQLRRVFREADECWHSGISALSVRPVARVRRT